MQVPTHSPLSAQFFSPGDVKYRRTRSGDKDPAPPLLDCLRAPYAPYAPHAGPLSGAGPTLPASAFRASSAGGGGGKRGNRARARREYGEIGLCVVVERGGKGGVCWVSSCAGGGEEGGGGGCGDYSVPESLVWDQRRQKFTQALYYTATNSHAASAVQGKLIIQLEAAVRNLLRGWYGCFRCEVGGRWGWLFCRR